MTPLLVEAYVFIPFIKSNLHPCIFPAPLGKKLGVVLFGTQRNKLFPIPQMILFPHPYPPIITTWAQNRPGYIPINSLHITMTFKLSHHLNVICTSSNDDPIHHLCQLVNPHNPSFWSRCNKFVAPLSSRSPINTSHQSSVVLNEFNGLPLTTVIRTIELYKIVCCDYELLAAETGRTPR